MRTIGFACVLAACTSSEPNEYDAVQVFLTNSNANSWGLIGAVTATPSGEEIQHTTNCPIAGKIGVNGTHDHRGTIDAAFDVDTKFVACNLGNPGTFNGSWDQIVEGGMHWTSDGAIQTMDGYLHYSGHSGTFDCTVSVRMTLGESTHYEGRVCGYDVRRDLGITP